MQTVYNVPVTIPSNAASGAYVLQVRAGARYVEAVATRVWGPCGWRFSRRPRALPARGPRPTHLPSPPRSPVMPCCVRTSPVLHSAAPTPTLVGTRSLVLSPRLQTAYYAPSAGATFYQCSDVTVL